VARILPALGLPNDAGLAMMQQTMRIPKMKWIAIIGVALAVVLLAWRSNSAAAALEVGQPAPSFRLGDQGGKLRQLSDYRGHWLVLYFYPKDDTPGCTAEACHFRDDIMTLRGLKAEVVGISIDAAESHARFAAKYHLPFPLLADTDGAAAQAYGALFKLGPFKLARRETFIIRPDGMLGQAFRSVDPANHAAEVARALRNLQASATTPGTPTSP
jgi:peroxiredoxin Q/BCP